MNNNLCMYCGQIGHRASDCSKSSSTASKAKGRAAKGKENRTDAEIAQTELRRHASAHAEVLESIGAAVAIYGADQRLKFFNAAFAAMWGLEAEWLAGEPSFGDVLERLR